MFNQDGKPLSRSLPAFFLIAVASFPVWAYAGSVNICRDAEGALTFTDRYCPETSERLDGVEPAALEEQVSTDERLIGDAMAVAKDELLAADDATVSARQ